MFINIMFTRLKCIFRDKQIVFWSTIFPFILAILFKLVLSGAGQAENFSEIPIAVIETTEFQQDVMFQEILKQTEGLFDIIYTDIEEADLLLDDNQIKAYVVYDDKLNLTARKSDIEITIVKSFLDEYMQMYSMIESISVENPEAIEEMVQNAFEKVSYLKTDNEDLPVPDTFLICFYSLIAMTCLYAGNLSIKEINSLQADSSPEGARISLVPVNKMKLFFASMTAVLITGLLEMILLMLFSVLVLDVDFGNKLIYVSANCITGTITGVLVGSIISSLIRKKVNLQTSIMILFTMIMCFLAGMMSPDIKYLIETNIPILSKINLISLITDNFYLLYYYKSYDMFFVNTAILWGVNIVLCIFIVWSIKRRKYADI